MNIDDNVADILKDKRILVVDDEEMITDLAKGIFERYVGVDLVDTANSFEDAKKLYNPDKHIATICDYRMPDGDEGYQMFKFVMSKKPDSLFYILSGQYDKNKIDQMKRDGLKMVFRKPINYIEMINIVLEDIKNYDS